MRKQPVHGYDGIEHSYRFPHPECLLCRIEGLEEQLEAAQHERDLIGTALGEPCAECGHIDWRSDGYDDMIRERLVAADEAVESARQQAASWEKVAREYETALADRGAL